MINREIIAETMRIFLEKSNMFPVKRFSLNLETGAVNKVYYEGAYGHMNELINLAKQMPL